MIIKDRPKEALGLVLDHQTSQGAKPAMQSCFLPGERALDSAALLPAYTQQLQDRGCQLELIKSQRVRKQDVLSSSFCEQHHPVNRFLSVAAYLSCSVCHRTEVLHVLQAFLCLNKVILQA